MRKFPAYKYEDILIMQAWLFYELIEQAQRIDAQETINQANIVGLPYMDKEDAIKFQAQQEWTAKDKEQEYVEPENAEQELKKIFGN